MLFFNPVVPLSGPVVLGVMHHIPAVLPVVRIRVVVRVKGIEVDLAKRTGSPPGRLQCLHEGGDVGIEPVAIGEQAVAAAGESRGNARPSRTADRVVGKRIGEGHAHALEAFQVRQVADAVHDRFQPLGPHLINHEEDDVGFVRCVHCYLSALPRSCSLVITLTGGRLSTIPASVRRSSSMVPCRNWASNSW